MILKGQAMTAGRIHTRKIMLGMVRQAKQSDLRAVTVGSDEHSSLQCPHVIRCAGNMSSGDVIVMTHAPRLVLQGAIH